MKRLLFIGILFLVQLAHSQQVMSLHEARTAYSQDSLNQIYYNELFASDMSEVFDVTPDVFIDYWSIFIRALGRHLDREHFEWGKLTRGQVEVYFNASGKIELFFFALRDTEFTPEKMTQLETLIKQFAAEFTFGIRPKIPFSNSGSFQFAD